MTEWVALSELLRNVALTIAAIVGAILAWRQLSPASLKARSANAHVELARRAHVTELFNRAVGQLRDPNLEVRLGAIYVLRKSPRTSPIFRILSSNFFKLT